MFAVFFVLVKPASTKANPGCIQNTNIAASNIQTVSNPNAKSVIVVIVSVSIFFFIFRSKKSLLALLIRS